MRFHHVLDEVLAAWSHIAILRVLQDVAQGLTGREIARQAGLSHRACHQALIRLEKLYILKRQHGGRSHFFTLNRSQQLVDKGLLPLLAVERHFSSELFAAIRKRLSKATLSIILFGSVARKQETTESDLDLCFIVRQAPNNASARGPFRFWRADCLTGEISMREFDRITFDPNIMGGRACIRGMRITVSLIVNLLANGMSVEEIIDAFIRIWSQRISVRF